MTMHYAELAEVVRRDPRYAYEAYEFVLFQALAHTQKMLSRRPRESGSGEEQLHVSGVELLEGIRDLALREFGMMARTVFHMWGIDSTQDIGQIVFNLVEAGKMSKTDQDSLDDFRGVYDLDEVFVKNFQIRLEEADST